MATQKLDPKKLEEAASKLRAIAHPMRIAIISLLERKDQMNVTEIYETLKIEQASASHHLNILKTKGVLDSRRAGKNTFYFLKQNALEQIIDCINRCH
ncbi:MAG: metalloregulator ArsR/SmtB family transcription factor [Bacteroides sp.]|jgi:DNA-binding transcriptional ArsR family regulator|nr:metalloregulator ArsR/SmtB family transcription factor [Bacteroides sp.]